MMLISIKFEDKYSPKKPIRKENNIFIFVSDIFIARRINIFHPGFLIRLKVIYKPEYLFKPIRIVS